jgi:F-type H+-transporting ATPase subunit a
MEEIEGPILVHILWEHLFPHSHIPAATITAWVVMALLIILSFILSRVIQLRPGKLQLTFEIILDFVRSLSLRIAGKAGEQFLPIFITLFLFILVSNWTGLIPGSLSPTSNININAAMAIVVAILAEGAAIKQRGVTGYLKHLCGPPYWLAPMFIIIRGMEIFTRPLSLTMRLFGNMLAKEIMLGVLVYLITLFFFSSGIMAKMLILVPLVLRPCILLLGVLVGFVQALVFTALAMSYIGSAYEEHAEHKEKAH